MVCGVCYCVWSGLVVHVYKWCVVCGVCVGKCVVCYA